MSFSLEVVLGDDQCLNEGRVVYEHIMDGLGAFNDEGAFSLSNPLVTEEFANARGLALSYTFTDVCVQTLLRQLESFVLEPSRA
jgi:hypothetical protein